MSTISRVLIIEDELVLQDVYKLVLSSQNYKVYTANNGQEGLSQVKNVRPDLILLDMFMPVMGGKEFLLNYDIPKKHAPKIIVYTNLFDKATRQEMLDLGADDFVLKSSMTPNDLLDLVARYLGKAS